MATEYGLDLGVPATADGVGDVLAQAAVTHGLAETDDVRFDPPGARLRSGLLVAVAPVGPLPFPHPVEEEFGFAPTTAVLFRLASRADTREQEQDLVRMVLAVLAVTRGDALLTFAGEIGYLLRKDGRLTISEAMDFWTPELVALLPPHERANLPTF